MKKIFVVCFGLLFAVLSFAVSTLQAQNNFSDGAVIGNFSDNSAANALGTTGSTAGGSAGAPGPDTDEDGGDGEDGEDDEGEEDEGNE